MGALDMEKARNDPTSLLYRPQTVPRPANPPRRGLEAIHAMQGTSPDQSRPPPPPATAKPATAKPATAQDNTLNYVNPPNSITSQKDGRVLGLAGRDANGRGPNSNFVDGFGSDFARTTALHDRGVQRHAAFMERNKGAGIVIPDNTDSRVADLYDKARSTTRNARPGDHAPIREARLYAAQAEQLGGTAQNATTVGGALRREAMSQAGANYRTSADNAAVADVRGAQAHNYDARAAASARDPRAGSLSISDYPDLVDSGQIVELEGGGPDMQHPPTAAIMASIHKTYEDGGLVQSFEDGGYVQGFAAGGPVSALGRATPQVPDRPALQAYQAYASGSQAMGLPPVGFEEFVQMQQGATAARAGAAGQGPMGFAEGGPVPDPSVSGKMVVDTDPATNGDTIPAMIDGEAPAALKSGEFVIPDDVVMFFGTDKLNKMIAQARKPADGGSETAGGPTALTGAGAAA